MFLRLFSLIELAFVITLFQKKKKGFPIRDKLLHSTLSIRNRIALKSQFLDNLDQLQTLGVTTNTGQVLIYED